MKFKYFLRGLGMGIVFGALIVFVAYQTSPNKLLTDEAVKHRAMELGMVEEASALDKVIKSETTEADATENLTTEETVAGTTESRTTEEAVAGTTESQIASTHTGKTVTIQVTSGMQSSAIAKKLEAAGVIADASAFDNYLNRKGYSTKLRVGTYQVKQGDSFAVIANILMQKSN